MSRDQKPGKFKLVGTAANPGRRIGDKVQRQAAAEMGGKGHVASVESAESPKSSRLFLPLMFLLCCAAGGAGAVMIGLVEGLQQ